MVLRKVRENACARIPITWQHFGAESADIRQSIPASLAQNAKKCGLPATEQAQKPGTPRSKFYFLSTNYQPLLIMKVFELIRTQSERGNWQWLGQR
jgi:hypothetical protein